MEKMSAAPIIDALTKIGRSSGHRIPTDEERRLSAAAWVARCVGRKETFPLQDIDLTHLARFLQPRNLHRGELLFAEGVESTGVWILVKGKIALKNGSGKKSTIVQILRGGDIDGDIAFLLGMKTLYSAWAMEDSMLYFIDSDAFEELLIARPQVARRWLTSVAQRLSHAQNRIVGLLGASVDVQIARLLYEEIDDGVVRLSQTVLGAMVGAQRSSINRVLRDFERKGVISQRYREIVIKDLEALLHAGHQRRLDQ